MVSSLDGFIASKDGKVEWMQTNDQYQKGTTLTEEYIEAFLKSIDCYVMVLTFMNMHCNSAGPMERCPSWY